MHRPTLGRPSLLSAPRYGATVNVIGSKVYFAGSANGVSTVDVYDSATNGWSVLVMPYKLAGMSGAVINDQIFYAGGYDPSTYAVSDVVQVYDTIGNTWSVYYLSQARLEFPQSSSAIAPFSLAEPPR